MALWLFLSPLLSSSLLAPASAHAAEGLVPVARWVFDGAQGNLVIDTVAGRNGLVVVPRGAKHAKSTRKKGLLFPGGNPGTRVRVDAGQPIDGAAFSIEVQFAPARDFTAGCLVSSRPPDKVLGGFRLCVSSLEQLVSFDVANGRMSRDYVAVLDRPLDPGVLVELTVRAAGGTLEFLLDGRLLKRFETPRLRLAKSPYPFVFGGGVEASRDSFRGHLRKVELRGRPALARRRVGPPPGYVTRGHWKLADARGAVVHDEVADHHGLLEDTPTRRPPSWNGTRLDFGGTPESGGVKVLDAGPLYGDDFAIGFEVRLENPTSDWGTMLATKTGSSVHGGFLIDYFGHDQRIAVKLADGKKQRVFKFDLPFAIPKQQWVEVAVRLANETLTLEVAGVVIDRREATGLVLARAQTALIIGAYYYPPSKGIHGSIRNVAFHMRAETIAPDEDAVVEPAPPSATATCPASSLRREMVVGTNVAVPNWLRAGCLEKSRRRTVDWFEFDVPTGFELVASGASRVEGGRVVENRVKRGKKVRAEGEDKKRHRRYRVELSFRLTAGHSAGYGPFYLQADPSVLDGAKDVVHEMFFRREGEETFQSVKLLPRAFPALPPTEHLHNSLTWMSVSTSLTWPDFFDNYRALGFNAVPVLTLYDIVIAERTRARFVKRARKHGFEIVAVDSPYHSMIFHPEARTVTGGGRIEPFVEPSYRGEHYDAELDRLAARVDEVQADWLMMDIECFAEGANACLIGTSKACRKHLATLHDNPTEDIVDVVSDLGTELIANIKQRLARDGAGSALPRLGMNTTEPNRPYHNLFDFNKLYDAQLDYAQPIMYRQSPEKMGERMRAIRAKMPRPDIIPWVDPGTVAEYPSEWVYDRLLEVLGAGARGVAWFSFKNFEGADFLAAAHALDALLAVESIIVDSEPVPSLDVTVGPTRVTGIRQGDHLVVVLRADRQAKQRGPRQVTLDLPPFAKGQVWDLARDQAVASIEGSTVSFSWQPGIEGAVTALYYIGPAEMRDGRVVKAAN